MLNIVIWHIALYISFVHYFNTYPSQALSQNKSLLVTPIRMKLWSILLLLKWLAVVVLTAHKLDPRLGEEALERNLLSLSLPSLSLRRRGGLPVTPLGVLTPRSQRMLSLASHREPKVVLVGRGSRSSPGRVRPLPPSAMILISCLLGLQRDLLRSTSATTLQVATTLWPTVWSTPIFFAMI